jgi:hypothetical protein
VTVSKFTPENRESFTCLTEDGLTIGDAARVVGIGVRGDDDDAAPTVGEVVLEHLGSAVKQADAHLKRRRRNLAENPPEEISEPTDAATRRFHEDLD